MKKPDTKHVAAETLRALVDQLDIESGAKIAMLLQVGLMTKLDDIHECVHALANKPPAKGNFIDLDGARSVNVEFVVSVTKNKRGEDEFFIEVVCQEKVRYLLGPMSVATCDIKYDLIMCQLKGVEKRLSAYGESDA